MRYHARIIGRARAAIASWRSHGRAIGRDRDAVVSEPDLNPQLSPDPGFDNPPPVAI